MTNATSVDICPAPCGAPRMQRWKYLVCAACHFWAEKYDRFRTDQFDLLNQEPGTMCLINRISGLQKLPDLFFPGK
jgi:hypothetical protein